MSRNVSRDEVEALQRRGVLVAEVLPGSEYRRYHIAERVLGREPAHPAHGR